MSPLLLSAVVTAGGCGDPDQLAAGVCAPGCPADQHCQDGTCMGAPVWELALPVNVHGEIAINSDGLIIASAASNMGNLYRPTVVGISPAGEMLWETQVGRDGPFGFPSRPVLDMDDGIYIVSNASLYSLHPDGSLKWTLDRPFSQLNGLPAVNTIDPPPSPSIGPDGTIYWQFLAATSKEGSLMWRQYIDPYTPCETALPVRPDRVMFRGGHQMFALDDDGFVAWNQEMPLGYFTEDACGMIPYQSDKVASLWCEPGPSAFVCGHVIVFDAETGEIEWSAAPPKTVAIATTMLLKPDMSLMLFSAGPPGNPDDRARMWTVAPDGTSTSESIELPWHGIWSASLGNDGIIYAVTTAGLAAITEEGEVLWRYEPEGNVGRFTGAPAIGTNGCVYGEVVKQMGRFDFERQVVCLQSSATGLADSPWPRSLGGNHSGMSPKY